MWTFIILLLCDNQVSFSCIHRLTSNPVKMMLDIALTHVAWFSCFTACSCKEAASRLQSQEASIGDAWNADLWTYRCDMTLSVLKSSIKSTNQPSYDIAQTQNMFDGKKMLGCYPPEEMSNIFHSACRLYRHTG